MWAFEVIPRLGLNYAVKKGSICPRMLNWECSVSPTYNNLKNVLFCRENVSFIFHLLLYTCNINW